MPETIFHTAPNEAPIREIYIFVSTDAQGHDGIVSAAQGGMLMPLVTSKRRIAELMRPMVQQIVRETGTTVKLLRFSSREELEVLNGKH